jgi:hypothetical protein
MLLIEGKRVWCFDLHTPTQGRSAQKKMMRKEFLPVADDYPLKVTAVRRYAALRNRHLAVTHLAD